MEYGAYLQISGNRNNLLPAIRSEAARLDSIDDPPIVGADSVAFVFTGLQFPNPLGTCNESFVPAESGNIGGRHTYGRIFPAQKGCVETSVMRTTSSKRYTVGQ